MPRARKCVRDGSPKGRRRFFGLCAQHDGPPAPLRAGTPGNFAVVLNKIRVAHRRWPCHRMRPSLKSRHDSRGETRANHGGPAKRSEQSEPEGRRAAVRRQLRHGTRCRPQAWNRPERKELDKISCGRAREDRGGAESQSELRRRRQRNRRNKSGDRQGYGEKGKHPACRREYGKSKKTFAGEARAHHRGASSQPEREHGCPAVGGVSIRTVQKIAEKAKIERTAVKERGTRLMCPASSLSD